MRIGIEAQRIFRKNKHGMDYVVLQEIKELQQFDTHNEYFVFVAPGEDRCLEDSKNVHIIETGGNIYPIWEQFTLPKVVSELKLDLLHCTSNTAPIWCSVPLVLTLHDIIFMEPRDKSNKSLYQNMGWLYRRLVVPRILKKCKYIITVSDFERNNIITRLGIPSERMVMIYNGYNEWFKPLKDLDMKYRKYVKEPGYFFFLGNTDPKKNTERTLIAYSKYLELSKVKRKLLMADLDKSYLDDIIVKNHIENIYPNIQMPGYIVNSDLPYIYNNAFAFLYTSLRESFGIPLLEAMACGTPVVASATGGLVEQIIDGQTGFLFPSGDSEALAQSTLRILNLPLEAYSAMKSAAAAQGSLFSLARQADAFIDWYYSIRNE